MTLNNAFRVENDSAMDLGKRIGVPGSSPCTRVDGTGVALPRMCATVMQCRRFQCVTFDTSRITGVAVIALEHLLEQGSAFFDPVPSRLQYRTTECGVLLTLPLCA
jgi:hypothetical protein